MKRQVLAYRPEPGDVVFIECAQQLSESTVERFVMQLKDLCPETKFVILTDGVRVAQVQRKPWWRHRC